LPAVDKNKIAYPLRYAIFPDKNAFLTL